MPAPLLSIVTPSLNQGRYLGDCLASVAREMASPEAVEWGVEHIVMDAGSTDATVGLLEAASHLAYWQSAPDGGQSAAINTGLRTHARGRYATWLNADDWYEPGALGPVLRRLAMPDAPDVLVGRCRFVEDGRTVFRPRPPEPLDMAALLRPRSRWFAVQLIVQPEAFFSRAMFERVGGLHEANHHTMDHELWLALLEAGARFEAIDHPVACLRVHDQQKTADNRRIVESFLRFGEPFLARHRATLGQDGPRAQAEMDALREKLALSVPVVRRLLAPWCAPTGMDPEALPHAPGPDAFHLAPLQAALEGVPRRRGPLRGAYRARVRGLAPAEGFPLRLAPSADGPHDLVLLWHALGCSVDPASTLREAIAGLRPGGLVVAAAEVAPCESDLRAYAQALVRLVGQQLSADHDWLIAPHAMDWVGSLRTATPQDDARWMAGRGRLLGLDAPGLMASAGLAPVSVVRYGGMSWHPLAPFEAPRGVDGAGHDAWLCGVWRSASG